MSCDRARRRCLSYLFTILPRKSPTWTIAIHLSCRILIAKDVVTHYGEYTCSRNGYEKDIQFICYYSDKWHRQKKIRVRDVEKNIQLIKHGGKNINLDWRNVFGMLQFFSTFILRLSNWTLNRKKLTCWPRTIGFSERYPRSLRWWRSRDCNCCARWETLIRKRLINGLCRVSVKSKEWRIEHTQKSKRFFFNDWHGRMVIDGESELLSVLGDLKSSGGLLPSVWMGWGRK